MEGFLTRVKAVIGLNGANRLLWKEICEKTEIYVQTISKRYKMRM